MGSLSELTLPVTVNASFSFALDDLNFNLQLYQSDFADYKGHWEKGGDGKTSWIDFIFYSGVETEFDLTKINRAALGFTFSIESVVNNQKAEQPQILEKEGNLSVKWNNFVLELPVKPTAPKNNFL